MAFRRWLLVFVLLTAGLYATDPMATCVWADNTAGSLKFNWAFVGYSKGDTGGELVRIEKDIHLKSGDKFKFFFETMQRGYVYLITQSSQAAMHLLFPQDLGTYDGPPPAVGAFYIPSGANWFQLDDQKGEERFYLLVSTQRLLELESLLKGYLASKGAQQAAFKDSVLSEVRRLRWKHRKFKKSAERPVAIMGQTRGIKKATLPDASAVSDLATFIEAENFFSRTFTIDHQ
jgi:hypothetical protein